MSCGCCFSQNDPPINNNSIYRTNEVVIGNYLNVYFHVPKQIFKFFLAILIKAVAELFEMIKNTRNFTV